MKAPTRALTWKETRPLASGLWSVPLALGVATLLFSRTGLRPVWGDCLMLAVAPLMAAQIGALGLAGERGENGLAFLRSRAASTARILAVKLAVHALAALGVVVTTLAIVLFWPGLKAGPWSEALDSPASLTYLLAACLFLGCFLWSFGFSLILDDAITPALAGALAGFVWPALLLAPAAGLAGRLEEALRVLPLLLPLALAPPALLAFFAARRFDPFPPPLPRRRVAGLLGVVAFLALAGFVAALDAPLEARSSLSGGARLPGSLLEHPVAKGLTAELVQVEGSEPRTLMRDGTLRALVLPEGSVPLGWVPRSNRLIVRWPEGVLRAVEIDGRTVAASEDELEVRPDGKARPDEKARR